MQLSRLLNLFYTLTVVTVKISLGLFFLHIFTVNRDLQRGLIYGFTTLSTVSGMVFAVMIEATCGISVAQVCKMQHAFDSISITWSILNAMSDLVLMMLSVQALWDIKLRFHIKVSAMALLIFACIGGAISIIRAVVNAGFVTKDPILREIEISRWSTIEGGIYIASGCLVTLRPLLQSLWQRVMGSEFMTSGKNATTASEPGRGGSFATRDGRLSSVTKKGKSFVNFTIVEVASADVKRTVVGTELGRTAKL